MHVTPDNPTCAMLFNSSLTARSSRASMLQNNGAISPGNNRNDRNDVKSEDMSSAEAE